MKKILFCITIFFIVRGLSFPQTSTRKLTLDTTAETESVYTPTGQSPEVVVQEPHSGVIGYAEYSKDGEYIFSVAQNEVKIWKSDTGALIRTFQGIDFRFDGYIWDFDSPIFSHDGKYFMYNSEENHDIYLCNILDKTKSVIGKNKELRNFSPSGDYFALCDDGVIKIYGTNDLNEKISIRDYVCSFISDSTVAVINESSNSVEIWDISNSKRISTCQVVEKLSDFSHMIPSKDSKFFIFFDTFWAHNVYVYDIENKKMVYNFDIQELGQKTGIRDVKCTSDGKLFVVGHTPEVVEDSEKHSSFIKAYNLNNGKEIKLPLIKLDNPESISFSPDEKTFVVAQKRKVEIFSAKTYKSLSALGESSALRLLDYLPKEDKFFIKSKSDKFQVFNKKFQQESIGSFADIFGNLNFYNARTLPYIVCDTGIYGVQNENGNYNIAFYENRTNSVKKIESTGKSDTVRFAITPNGKKYLVCWLDANPKKFALCDENNLTEITAADRNWWNRIFSSSNGKFFAIECSDCVEIYETETGNKSITLSKIERELIDSHGNRLGIPQKIYMHTSTKEAAGAGYNQKNHFSYDDKYFLYDNYGSAIIYDTSNWKIVYEKQCLDGFLSYSGKYLAVYSPEENIEIYDIKTEKKICKIPSGIPFDNLHFYDNDRKFVIISYGGLIKNYDVKTGKLLSSTIADESGDYLTYTPEGYFTGSPGGINKFVHLVDGMQVFELGQLYDTLYRPDLVQAKLEGKDIGAPVLKDIVATGDAPRVQFVGTPMATSRNIKLEFSVQDSGGGIGYVYLSQNGKTMQVSAGEESKTGRKFIYTCDVTLAAGENVFEAYAANSANKIESRHISVSLNWQGKVEKSNLYVLAMGVDKYTKMPKNNLRYSVADANAIIESFKTAPGGLYSSVNVMTLLDSDVNKANIENAFDVFSAKVKPDDMFVLHIAGHGVNYGGEYYYLPADTFAKTDADFAKQGISKHFLTENLSKLQALNMVVLLDTCYSGAFIDTNAKGNALAQQTALEHLQHTSGQVILTGASNTQTAGEGYNGHGIFTYAILEALSGKANYNADGAVSIKEITQYIGYEIPNIYEKMGFDRQSPWNSLIRGDFSLVAYGNKSPSLSKDVSLKDNKKDIVWVSKRIVEGSAAGEKNR